MSVKGLCLQSFHDLELILCSQLTANLLERFQGLRYCGSSQAFPARVPRDYSVIFVCRLLCIPPFWSSFMLVVSVVPQRLTVAASGILALQIRFPSPFPTYIYIFSFCSLSGPDSHSQLLSLYFWMMLGENYKVCLAE